jgi:hypothetical protein
VCQYEKGRVSLAKSKEEQAFLLSIKNGKASTQDLISAYRSSAFNSVLNKKLRLHVAERPDAPKEILEELSRSKKSELWCVLARNPSVPLERLLILADKFPWEFMKNPVIPLLLLEDPGLSMMSDELLTQIVSYSTEALDMFWSAVEQRPSVLLSVAYKSHQKESILRRILKTNAEEAIVAAIQNAGATPEIFELASQHPSISVRISALGRPLSIETLERLSMDSSADVRKCVAVHRQLPEPTLRRLSQDEKLSVIAAVVNNVSSPVALLEEIFARGLAIAPALFAQNPNTPSEILLKIAQQENTCLFELAQNIKTPLRALQIILFERYNSESPIRILGALATNPNADTAMLQELITRGSFARRHVALNENTPHKLLQQLSQDPDEQTANNALQTLKR